MRAPHRPAVWSERIWHEAPSAISVKRGVLLLGSALIWMRSLAPYDLIIVRRVLGLRLVKGHHRCRLLPAMLLEADAAPPEQRHALRRRLPVQRRAGSFAGHSCRRLKRKARYDLRCTCLPAPSETKGACLKSDALLRAARA